MTFLRNFTLVPLLCLASWMCAPAIAQDARDAYIVLIDTSVSMQETPKGWNTRKIDEVKQQLADFCTALPRETQVMIYTFDSSPPRPGPRVVVRDDSSRAELRRFFDDLRAKGNRTHAWSSLEVVLLEAKNLIKAEPQTTVHLLMYTDGNDNQKPQRDLNMILSQFDDVLKDQVRMSYVTLGFTLGEEFRKTLAAHNVQTIPVADKNELIPLDAVFGWAPSRVTTEVDLQFFDKTNAKVESYQWAFGDGTLSTEQTPAHRYGAPGRYTVHLTVKGPTGKIASAERVVEVLPAEPITAVGRFVPARVNLGETVQFISESTGGVTEFEWDFGDGVVAGSENPSHVYAQPGEYRVRLTVSRGAEKQSVTLDHPVIVAGPLAPTARMFAPPQGMMGESLRFVDASSGTITQQSWDLGDGSVPVTGREATHAFDKPGRYTVKLTVTGPGGTSNVVQDVEVISPPKPEPDFIVGSTEIHIHQTVVMADLTKQPVDRVTWDFGDGSLPEQVDYTTASEEATRAVRHTFDKPGRFEVTLTVMGPGGSGTVRKWVEAKGHEPPVAKIVLGAETRAGDPTVFNDASTGAVTRATWLFGDGTQPLTVEYGGDPDPTRRTVQHTFQREGTYQVTLDVEGPGGADRDQMASVEVKPSERAPRALFEVDQRKGRGELTVRFINRSSGSISQYVWDFGDGSKKIVHDFKQDVEHRYGPGEFVPTLTAEGTKGFAPNTYRAEKPIIVKKPWPAWVKHLSWITPLILVGLIALTLSAREMRWRAHLKQLANLSGSLFCRPAADSIAPLEMIEVKNVDGDASAWEFRVGERRRDGQSVEYSGRLRKTITVVQRPQTEIVYTMELSRDGVSIGSATVEDGERAKVGPFIFEYRES